MTAENFCTELFNKVSGINADDRLEVTATEIAHYFGVEVHEIGLFKLDEAGRIAVFVWPPHRLGSDIKIPIKSFATSLISTTANERSGSVDNHFRDTPHLHMFEHALTEVEHRIPMQKVMTAPGSEDDKLRWIIQVSRKGQTLEEAGADFTNSQFRDLEVIAQAIVKFPI